MAQWQEEWGEEMKWRQTTGTVCIDPQQWERTAWWEMWWVDFRPLWHFYIKVFEWVFGLTSFMHQAGEESSHSNLPTDRFFGLTSSLNNCWDLHACSVLRTQVCLGDEFSFLIAPVPPAGHWAPAVPVEGCSCWRDAGRRLPGRPTTVQSAGAAGGACLLLDSPLRSNALCPGRKCPWGSVAPDPEEEINNLCRSVFGDRNTKNGGLCERGPPPLKIEKISLVTKTQLFSVSDGFLKMKTYYISLLPKHSP